MRQFSSAREMARLLHPYLHHALWATATGGLSGLATVGLLSLINQAMKSGLEPYGAASFIALCAIMLGTEILSYRANSLVMQGAMADLRKSVVEKMLSAPIDVLERMQNHRVIVALNHDVQELTGFFRGIPFVFVSLLTALACVGYLFIVSPRLAALAAIASAIPMYVFRRMLASAFQLFYAEHEARDALQKEYDQLILGSKELRLNRDRRLGFRKNRLFAKIEEVSELTRRNYNLFASAEAIDAASAFVTIGCLLAAQQYLGERPETLGTFVVGLLYLRGPVNSVVGYLSTLGRAAASFQRIVKLRDDFATPEAFCDEPIVHRMGVGTILLSGITYEHRNEAGAVAFALGPIDLEIRRGETMFIVGENGSGKTTLVKLLLGLYRPASGEIRVDGELVTDDNRDDYRQHFSAVFFDYCLFDDVAVNQDNAEAANDYLARMDLSKKAAIVDGVFSTTALSAGQRKRLALVSAYAEGRPVMVLDEWAAEQDPTFRRAFYQEILPDLKRRGKTMICVSHDDRYFDAADRIVHISDGKIANDTRQ
jgi:putative ATP-binding cassette transporter